MATLTSVNPRLVAGPVMETANVLIKNGSTWNAGQFLRIDTSGLLVAAASDDDAGTGGFQYFALTDQTDPGNSTTYAKVGVIHEDHVFEINELDGTIGAANIGQHYGIDVTSNVVTIDVGDTTNDALVVVDVASNYNPLQNSAADVKGRARVKVLAVVLDAARAA